MVEFGGWEMPLAYPGGTLAEHRRCRRAAAAFDVSHLGTVRVEGGEARERLQHCLSNDLDRIQPGRAQYSHLLDPSDGSVQDDVIVWWLAPERFDVVANASNTARVIQAIGGREVTAERAVIAVQGPTARDRLRILAPEAASVPRFGVGRFTWRSYAGVAAGTGYTGEDGLELALPLAIAESFWAALIEVGVAPAGLGARDTLRLEAGLPLHGHELGPGITPLQAGLGWVVGWDKPDFRGRRPLEAERIRGVSRRLRGLVMEDRRPPRPGCPVLAVEGVGGGNEAGEPLGMVTSGNYSPTLDRGIGLALLSPAVTVDQPVAVDIRGHVVPALVVRPPFAGPGVARRPQPDRAASPRESVL